MDISRSFCLVSLSAILAYMVNSIAKENIAATTLKLVKLIKEFYITSSNQRTISLVVLSPSFVFWTIYLLDLSLNCIDKLWVFQWILMVLNLFQVCFSSLEHDVSFCDWSLSCVCRLPYINFLFKRHRRSPNLK